MISHEWSNNDYPCFEHRHPRSVPHPHRENRRHRVHHAPAWLEGYAHDLG
nr:MAG TPA: hypothetical protein [Caudoviricetes sp.]